jgi:hypothetical protein
MVIAVLTGDRASQITESGVWEEVASLLSRTVGIEVSGDGEALRRTALRHILLAELSARLGDLQDEVAPSWAPPTGEQARSAAEILETWRRDREGIKTYVPLCLQADRELGLDDTIAWQDSLADLDSLPAVEAVAMREALRRLETNDYAGAADLAHQRLNHSLWAAPHPTAEGLPPCSSGIRSPAGRSIVPTAGWRPAARLSVSRASSKA